MKSPMETTSGTADSSGADRTRRYQDLAKRLLIAGQYEQAHQVCMESLGIEPRQPQMLNLSALTLSRLGRTQQALTQMDQAICLCPDAAEFYNSRGILREGLNDISGAIQDYRQALALKADLVDSAFNLAVLMYHRGDPRQAASYCDLAIRLRPDLPEAHLMRGAALQKLRDFAGAKESFETAIRIQPESADAWHHLGLLLAEQEQFESAVEAYRRAMANQPNNADLHNHLGLSLRRLGKTDEAIFRYRKAVELVPDHALAMFNLANVLKENRKMDEAVTWYRRSLDILPDHADGYNNLGTTFNDLSRYEEAIAVLRKAISLKPKMAVYHNNLGLAFEAAGRSESAVMACRQAIDCDPDFAEAHRNLADSLRRLGRCSEAIDHYRTALRLRPDYAEAEWNLSIAFLLDGQLDNGFGLYHRRQDPSLKIVTYPHRYEVPRWDGSSFDGKTLLVHCEQGLGDSIQFVRYLPRVQSLGGRVLLEAPKTLLDLFKGIPGVDEFLEFSPDRKTTAPFDLFAAIMDLPAIFHTTLETIPDAMPYLFAPKDRMDLIGRHIATDDLRIGFVWSGNPKNPDNPNRSCRFERFMDLVRIPGLTLYSVQKPGMAENAKCQIQRDGALRNRIVDLAEHLHDMSDTAAAIESLDLVITVDTSVAHLAGAMNKPVWILLSAAADWRWLLGRDDSPWYRSARLIRQKQLGDWTEVFARIRRALERIVQADPSGRVRLLREIHP